MKGLETEGEFARTDAIAAVVGRYPKLDEEIIIDDIAAALIPEPGNPYDAHAVAVVVNGRHVAYLSRDDARTYVGELTRVIDAGYAPTTRARIWTVQRTNRSGLKMHANVRIALGSPEALLPVNEPPTTPHAILPWGRAQQVTGEEKHIEHLADYIGMEGRRIIGTLHLDDVRATERSRPKAAVEVRIDEATVGHLSAAMSQHYIPAIEHLAAQGLTTAAWLHVKGSPIAAQVTVHAAKAHEIPTEWFARPDGVASLERQDPPASAPPMWGD